MKTAAICGIALFILILDLFASAWIVRSEVHSRTQKVAWLLLVWWAPLLGAIWALQVSVEKAVPAPVSGSLEEGSRIEHSSGGFV